MKRIYFLVSILISISASAQITENFSDGDFTNNPTWSGDAGQFIVNASQQLQLNSSGTSVSYLSSALSLATLDSSEWRCYVKQTFSGSTSNNGKIYLTSDQSNLESPLNGYYLQLGEALSNDAVELFKQTGSTSTSVARCTNGAIANSFAIGIKVTRSANAEWKVYIDYSGGNNYLLEASGVDATFNTSAFYGVVCTYTSSNATAFYFDDFFYGPIQVDSIAPAAIKATVISQNQLDVYFSEAISATSAETELNYSANNNLGTPLTSVLDGTNASLVHLTFSTNIPEGILNTLIINNIYDLSNNIIPIGSAIDFVLPATPAKNEIVINEILFNPRPDEFDFVELYNNSERIFDLKNIYLANADSKDSIDSYEPASSTSKYFFPGNYLLLTENIASVLYQYTKADTSNYIQTDLPSFNDDEDVVVVIDPSFKRIDQFNYSEDYHYPLLNDKEGVSLERINFSASTQDKSNWHSAASTVGYATPGYENSQHIEGEFEGNEILIEPEIFSPDNDGLNDVLSINYNFNAPGYAVTINIYNENGSLIKKLLKNQTVSPQGSFIWDGITDKNEKAPIGIYVFYLEAFNAAGDVKKLKKPFVVASKL